MMAQVEALLRFRRRISAVATPFASPRRQKVNIGDGADMPSIFISSAYLGIARNAASISARP